MRAAGSNQRRTPRYWHKGNVIPPFTRPEAADTRLITLAQTAPGPRAPPANPPPRSERKPVLASRPEVPAQASVLATTPSPGVPDNLPSRFTVVGSFANLNNAQQVATGIEDHDARVVKADTRHGLRYRVVLSSAADPLHSVQALTAKGFVGAWSMTLCGASLNPPPCEQAELVAAAGN